MARDHVRMSCVHIYECYMPVHAPITVKGIIKCLTPTCTC